MIQNHVKGQLQKLKDTTTLIQTQTAEGTLKKVSLTFIKKFKCVTKTIISFVVKSKKDFFFALL